MTKVDVIIVGQGLAGSVLALLLLSQGRRVLVYDPNKPQTSSKVAAGLVNPITGRRFVLSWNFDEFNSKARSFYSIIEKYFDCQFIHDIPFYRVVEDERFIDDIDAKTGDPYYQSYFNRVLHPVDGVFKPARNLFEIHGVYRLDIQLLLRKTRGMLLRKGLLIENKFDYDHISHDATSVSYQDTQADYIVFCEGAAAVANPFFGHLPFQPTKGELFHLRHRGSLSFAYKHELSYLPIAPDRLWCGALSHWDFADDRPSSHGERILLEKLRRAYLPDPYIEDHLAAIRPTIRDRRPVIGRHPLHSRLAILNGLGTKGALLAPLLAITLASHLYENEEVPAALNLMRFSQA